MYKHLADSIKETDSKVFVSLEEKTKFNNYEDIMRKKDDSYSKTEVDNKIKELSDSTYGTVESSYVSESSTLDGYIKDLEVYGNTVQNEEDLSDIKSVGELQEDGTYKMSIVSCGKNLFNSKFKIIKNATWTNAGEEMNWVEYWRCEEYIQIKPSTEYRGSFKYDNVNKFLLRFYYDKDKNYISCNTVEGNGITPSNAKFMRISGLCTNTAVVMDITKVSDIQLEESVNTPYEPYQESRVDISLPCQLEKIGDVSDRLYYDEEEKAWCIEKNIGEIILNGTETLFKSGTSWQSETIFSVYMNIQSLGSNDNINCICNKFISTSANILDATPIEAVAVGSKVIILSINRSKLTSHDINGFKTWLNQNPTSVKYQLETPQKIILPLDTQIQLNSYANKTHIYTVSGDIEPTIKAVLSKSLGASVQSLNEKTDIMLNRLENVEKLKEGQNLSYESNKGYVVCENTNNGQIDNIKIEGKTLVNLCPWKFTSNEWSGGTTYWFHLNYKIPRLEVGKTYSFCAFANYTNFDYISLGHANNLSPKQIHINENGLGKFHKFTAKEITENGITIIACKTTDEGFTDLEKSSLKAIIVEGDYEGYECSYFEGLCSVGHTIGNSNIEILSSNKNIFKEEDYISKADSDGCIISTNDPSVTIVTKPNITYTLSQKISRYTENVNNKQINACRVLFLDKEYREISTSSVIISTEYKQSKSVTNTFTTPPNCSYIRIRFGANNGDVTENYLLKYENIQLEINNTSTEYILNKSHNKSLLYYNDLGELVPVPCLHEWDSIEKHSDGKWYYHKRSEKVVLNGSEGWYLNNESVAESNTLAFYIPTKPKAKNLLGIICDLFHTDINIFRIDYECIRIGSDQSASIFIRINKSRLSSENVEGFKTWLSSNNVTVVYELAEEQVYECINLNLDTYDNETMVMVNTGAITPKLSFNVSSHIGNTVSILRERLKSIEEEYIDYKTTQDKLLLTTIYSSDRGSFSVSTLSSEYDYQELEEIDYELFEITKSVIEVGLDNYNITDMEELIDFYTIIGKFDYDMADILFEMIENQINPPVIEIPAEEIEILPEI